jgi:hypothetical protein
MVGQKSQIKCVLCGKTILPEEKEANTNHTVNTTSSSTTASPSGSGSHNIGHRRSSGRSSSGSITELSTKRGSSARPGQGAIENVLRLYRSFH